jgi:hypothetical protein
MKKVVVDLSISFTYEVDDDNFDVDYDGFEYEEKAFSDLAELVRDEYFNDFDIEIKVEDSDTDEDLEELF